MHTRAHARADGQEAVSEIVGALLLVLVVSSAAFGFGLFLHQQQKETQAQQAAELAIKLERVVVRGVAPDAAADACGAGPSAPAGAWTALAFTLASRHLHDTTITQLTLNGLAVKAVTVGAATVDFSLGPEDPGYTPLVVPAGQSIVVTLPHASCDAATGLSPFFSPPASGVGQDAPLDLAAVTALGNHVETAFVPPVAIASLQPTPGVANSYVLVGDASQAGAAGAFLTKWVWEFWTNAPCAPSGGTPLTSGHQAQVGPPAINAGDVVCVRLTVTDNNGLSGTTTISFTA